MSETEYDKLKAEIETLHLELTKYVIHAKVGPASWMKLLKVKGRLRSIKVLAFLKDLKRHEWQNVHTAWTQMIATDEYWESLNTLYKDEKLPEHVKLLSNLRKLKVRVVEFKKELRNISIED